MFGEPQHIVTIDELAERAGEVAREFIRIEKYTLRRPNVKPPFFGRYKMDTMRLFTFALDDLNLVHWKGVKGFKNNDDTVLDFLMKSAHLLISLRETDEKCFVRNHGELFWLLRIERRNIQVFLNNERDFPPADTYMIKTFCAALVEASNQTLDEEVLETIEQSRNP